MNSIRTAIMEKKHKIKILFVDDEPEVIRPLAAGAEDNGYEALLAFTPQEAWGLLSKHHENLAIIISDQNMGGGTGLEFREKMLADFKDIPFVIYSGYVTEDMLRCAIDLKISKFLDKPCDISKINDIIEKEAKSRIEQIEEKTTLRTIFVEEALDLLEDLEAEILALEANPAPAQINNIFRLVHTIKGGSGVLDWPEFTRAVHAYEDLLTKVKSGDAEVSKDVISTLLSGYDFVSSTITEFEKGNKQEIDVDHWIKVFSVNTGNTAKVDQGQGVAATSKKSEDDVIKVPTKILDEFMELSGEITVIRNTVNKLVSNIQKEISGNSDIYLLAEFLDEMHKINSAMQSKITEMRKVSLRNIYRTYPRTVRDLNLSLGKQIDLKISGDELRVDTKLAQVLKNSLIHIIRNSADHGIESKEKREERNKSPRGLIELRSFEQGDDVIVEIEDNGGGINSEFIKKRAIEKSLYPAEVIQSMNEKQAYQIIMEPGFSTAAQITDVSGRGVGMDMVKSSVESIGGKIEIDSRLEHGTKFSLKLPVPKSVTIIQSLLVTIGGREYTIPQDNIIRLIKVEKDRRSEMIQKAQGSDFLRLDDHLIQLIDLSGYLSKKGDDHTAALMMEDVNIVLVKSESVNFGILVEEIKDTEEIVVKKIPNQIKEKLFKGATFMGDGSVGLILDIDGIAEFCDLQQADAQEETRTSKISQALDRTEYIIFTIPRPGLFAFELEHVYRLEELETSKFTFISDQLSTIYRGHVIPLYYVHTCLDQNSQNHLVEKEKQSTIILRFEDNYYGLIIDNIKEIRNLEGEVDSLMADHRYIIGNFILSDAVITVLDIHKIANLELPKETKPAAEAKKPSAAESQNSITADTPEFSGWGLF